MIDINESLSSKNHIYNANIMSDDQFIKKLLEDKPSLHNNIKLMTNNYYLL